MSLSQPRLEEQAFPVLSEKQLALPRPLGEVRPTRAGDILFEVGDAAYHLVVVLAGRTEIVERSEGVDRVIKTSGPGKFHGELGLLTGQTVFATCVVREPGAVLLMPPDAVRQAIATIPALSDVLVPAFAAPGDVEEFATRALFVMIGADPWTDCQAGTFDLDDRAFVVAGQASPDAPAPVVSPYQTSLPGVFAVGDVRSGSVKRVASAVGEGSVVVQAVHAYLAATARRDEA